MCITEYDEAKHMAQMEKLAEDNLRIGEERGLKIGEERGLKIGEERGLKIGEERGLKIGEDRGRLLMLVDLVKTGLLSISDAAKFAHMTVSEFESKAELEAR